MQLLTLGLMAIAGLLGLFLGFLIGARSGYVHGLEQCGEIPHSPDELRAGAVL